MVMKHIETTEPVYSKVKQPKTIYRYNSGNGRIYWREDEKEGVKLYLSVTTFIKRSMPTSPFLINWMVQNGKDAEDIKNEAADYGTFMHIEMGRILTSMIVDLDGMEVRLQIYAQEGRMKWRVEEWVEELKSDLLAFAQFVIEHEVEPIAIEMVLCSEQYGFAGAIDLICTMNWEEKGFFGETYKSGENKGEPKESKRVTRITAALDAKSGRKGFYDDHVVQLAAYDVLIKENFPEIKIDKLFNWAPKDWRNTPTYHLKDQTDSWNIEKFPHMMAMAEMDDMRPDRKITVMEGKIDLKKGTAGLAAGYKTMSLAERIKDLKKNELDTKKPVKK